MKNKGHRYFGGYVGLIPTYVPIDLKIIKNILQKDFDHFVDRGLFYNEKHDPISATIFFLGGSRWKNMRTKLTPVFTSGKLKSMFQLILDSGNNLEELMEQISQKQEPIDIKDVLNCYTLDAVGTCSFGLDFKSFKDPNSPFKKYSKRITEIKGIRRLLLLMAFAFPDLAKKLGVKSLEPEVSNFFFNMVRETIDYRKKNGINRPDFVQMLMNQLEGSGENSLTFEQVVAQCLSFYLAGHETSSTTATFALLCLSQNPDVQDKLRSEIFEVLSKHDGKITYDSMNDMKYMGQVIDETLRMFPPLPTITRQCIKDYKLPDSDLIIEKGNLVVIPITGVHYDKEYYQNPDQFDPEHFSPSNREARDQYAHIPFGEGPRICIGMRFGIIQTKVALTTLLRKYRFSISNKMKIPIELDEFTAFTSVKGGVWLDAEKI